MQTREAAWAALHTPTTEPAELAQIAAAYPEFAEAIAAHPNVYPELRAWALAQQSAKPNPWQRLRANHSNELLISAAGLSASLLLLAAMAWWWMVMDEWTWAANVFGSPATLSGADGTTYNDMPVGAYNGELFLMFLSFAAAFVGGNVVVQSSSRRVATNLILSGGLCALLAISNWSWFWWVLYQSLPSAPWYTVAHLCFLLATASLIVAWVVAAERHPVTYLPLGVWAAIFLIVSLATNWGLIFSIGRAWIVIVMFVALAAATLFVGLRLPARQPQPLVSRGGWG